MLYNVCTATLPAPSGNYTLKGLYSEDAKRTTANEHRSNLKANLNRLVSANRT